MKKVSKSELITAVLCAVIIIGILFIVLRLSGIIGPDRGDDNNPTACPSEVIPTGTPEGTPDNTQEPTAAPTEDPATPTPTEEPTPTPTPSPTPTPAPTATPTPTPFVEMALKEYIETELNSEANAADFINSKYKGKVENVYFSAKPDTSKLGEKNVEVNATVDGEKISVDKKVRVVDTTAPVIKGVTDKTVYVGYPYKFKNGVTVTDNSGETLDFEVDISKVNLQAVGDYEVIYSARDSSGNVGTKKMILTVTPDPGTATQQMAYDYADGLLKGIIKEGMTEAEKCTAIYVYIKKHMGYYDHHYYEDYIKCAYFGMTQYYGDCYVYYSYAKVLLERAGFETMMVSRTTTPHYWNLVKVNGQWYHFDTTPRASGGEFCLLTDAELKAYSDAHGGTHVFDTSLVPATATESLGIVPKVK